MSIGFSVQKFKTDFQDGGSSSHLGFPIGMILAIFGHPDASYQVLSQLAFPVWRSSKKIFKMATEATSLISNKFKTDFQEGQFGFLIRVF